MAGRLSLLAVVAISLASSGCAGMAKDYFRNGFKVGPDYCKPAAQVADAWIDVDDPRVVSAEADHSQWWTVFNDPTLNSLVQTAYQQNLPLRQAALRVMEARAQLGVARGGLFPQVQELFGSYQRIQTSRETIPSKSIPPAFSGKRAFDYTDVGFDAAWELDIWGRYRRSIEASDASLNATVEDYDAVLVTLVADVAATYVEVRTLEKRLAYARQNVDIQKGSLNLAEVRFRNGAVTELDVQQAKSNVSNTEAAVPALESSVRQAKNRLCILLGIPPQNIEYLLGAEGEIPTAPPEVAVGIPADLLRRRPDVRAAERLAAAQSARIGIAGADLFPAFTISGSIGWQAEYFSDLFKGSSNAGFLAAPGINWNILNYGRIRNNIRAQDAVFQQLVVSYQNTVLKANQEAEDALVAFLKSQLEARALSESAKAAQRSVELALTQYRDGAIDFNRVFSLEAFLVTQQDQLAQTQGNIAINLARTFKALGGGWQIRMMPAEASMVEFQQSPVPIERIPPAPPDVPMAPPEPPAPPAPPLPGEAVPTERAQPPMPVRPAEPMPAEPMPVDPMPVDPMPVDRIPADGLLPMDTTQDVPTRTGHPVVPASWQSTPGAARIRLLPPIGGAGRVNVLRQK